MQAEVMEAEEVTAGDTDQCKIQRPRPVREGPFFEAVLGVNLS